MKSVFLTAGVMLYCALQIAAVAANEIDEYRADADHHYLQHNYKKAYKIYYKLAKAGDNYSQARVAQIYATGEGKTADLTKAYAWSVLAAESGEEKWADNSNELLERIDDKTGAQKSAAKLKKKYGSKALKAKARKQAKWGSYRSSGRCTGSHLSCAGG